MPKTKLEIIEETAAYYSQDVSRRAINSHNNGCYYKMEDGRKCAVGRCMTEEAAEEFRDAMGPADSLEYRLNNDGKSLDSLLQDSYKGHDFTFWNALQRFHDDPDYWNSNGLTIHGKAQLEALRTTYSEN